MFKNNNKVLIIIGCFLVPLMLQATSTLPKLKGGIDNLKVLIEFPMDAFDNHLQDDLVEVEFFIEVDGSITNPRIVSESHAIYNQTIIKALKDIKFEPATSNGSPVRVLYRMPIYFKI